MEYKVFVDRVADAGDYSKLAAKELIRLTFKVLGEVLGEGEELKVPNLGTFYTSSIKCRHVPSYVDKDNGIDLPRTRTVRFRPSPSLKKAVKSKEVTHEENEV